MPESLPDVSADPALLTTALANLVGNALRHASGACPPRITAGEILHDGTPRVAIRIIDRGPGIRPADRELVFQPFQRLVDHQADGTGVGLGLAIARGFVDSMGGELTLDDTPGGGVTMVVELPLAPPGAARDQGPHRRRRSTDATGAGGQPARSRVRRRSRRDR